MKKQVFNPYLPMHEYVPDGEPHLFDGRVYIYGSHDKAFGAKYCEENYVTWSAPEEDLTDWRFEGEIYRRTQDPSNAADEMQLWAPDVTKGPDGRYYLYYCFSFYPEIGVAVSDSPAGPFEFYGHVKYPAHIHGGAVLREFMPFDPAVLTDTDGQVYLYYGFAPGGEKEMLAPNPDEMDISEEEKEELRRNLANIQKAGFGENSMVAGLEADMVTLKEVPRVLIPGEKHAAGTSFAGHGFFEASSIRRVGEKYYFVYSSHKSHELCYAISDRPDRDYRYGGTLVSNGDIGLEGRTEPVNVLGNNHGGMVQAAGQWYIFYHRQTNGTEFSRQGCAEPITIREDGSIEQVPITSCGLNGGPLAAEGAYPAAIACHITDPTTVSRINYKDPIMQSQTRVTAAPDGQSQYITDVTGGSVIGYKYFDFRNVAAVVLTMKGTLQGSVVLSLDPDGVQEVGRADLALRKEEAAVPVKVSGLDGVHGLYFRFDGAGRADLFRIAFEA